MTATSTALADAIAALPDALREPARRGLAGIDAVLPYALLPTAVRVAAVSEFAARTLQREQDWLAAQAGALQAPPDPEQLQRFAASIAASEEDPAAVKRALRRYRNRYLLHVLWREVAGSAELDETLAALSGLADQLLAAAAGFALRQLAPRFGTLRDAAGEPVPLVVLGMGKLGGGELNFSSDIDIVFLYPGGDVSDGRRSLSAPEYITRLSQQVVALLDEVTADGFVFRVDTRLRPFGDSGPPVLSFAALEQYLQQHGRSWERYAYIKARIVGPQPPAAVVDDLYRNIVTPFVYRRYLDFGVFESLRKMHALIAAEVQRRELADNVKLGPGGIREIEFIVQSLQLVRGGSRRELQERRLRAVLRRLAGRDLREADVATLDQAYVFLRRVENFIQAQRDRQTHDLPRDPLDRQRLLLAMGYADWDVFRSDLQSHRDAVAVQFERIAFREQSAADDAEPAINWPVIGGSGASVEDWQAVIEALALEPAADIAAALHGFVSAPATARLDRSAQQRLQNFLQNLLFELRDSPAPLVAIQRVLTIAEQILRRSAYFALLNENRPAMSRLVDLCERSAYISRELARHPVLLDELLDPTIYTTRIGRDGLAQDLAARSAELQDSDSEARMELLVQFQRANQFRIALADWNGDLPIMRVSDSLTELAEIVLAEVLQIAWADLAGKHGKPGYRRDGQVLDAGFGIIAYGKLGGLELSYGSDLDLVFLHDAIGGDGMTDGERPIDNTMFFTRLVRRMVHFLTTQTGAGLLYEIDMRLRPDGQSGLLVTSVEAFERYQVDNAWTWEHQALLRARPVAGSAAIATEFQRIRSDTLCSRVRRESLRADVVSMRHRMRDNLDQSNPQQFDLKQGRGGIGDIEFLVQYLVLDSAAEHPGVIEYSDNIRQLDALAAAGVMQGDDAEKLQDIYRAYRLSLHRGLLNDTPPLLPATEFATERAAVTALWRQWLDD